MEGTPKAIEMKGIVRNATKIGVQDGQAEDLINLRFMDGSWRASGDGRLVHTMSGTQYTQLYVHTNVYHHLLGVNNGTLYWFAEIGTDGVSFYPLDGTTSRTNWPQDMQSIPTSPVAITSVNGDLWIVQTGHLITVIDGETDFEYFIFKIGDNTYKEVDVDVNGKATDRSLYPFGHVHFNLYQNPDFTNNKESEESVSPSAVFPSGQTAYTYNETGLGAIASSEIMHSQYVKMLAEQSEKNRFTQPFLVICALKLYDGSFAYSSNPVLLNPNEIASRNNELYCYNQIKDGWEAITVDDFFDKTVSPSHITNVNQDWKENSFLSIPGAKVYGVNNVFTFEKLFVGGVTGEEIPEQYDARQNAGHHYLATIADAINEPTFSSGGYVRFNQTTSVKCKHRMLGYNLVVSFGNEIATFLSRNSDIIKSVCIFVTPQIENLKLQEEGNSTEKRYGQLKVRYYKAGTGSGGGSGSMFFGFVPNVKPTDEILSELIHQPFYLLREYNENTISELLASPIVDLSATDYTGIIKPEILVQQQTLTAETLSRTTYLPKVSYMYNGRLHIANYKSYPFFGYPIDLFHLHSHSVKVQADSWFKGVLPNLTGNNDDYLQYPKAQKAIINYEDLVTAGAPYFLVKVYIDSSQGEQVVCRYIPAYNPSPAVNGRADFIEDLNPLLTYPDARAKKMDIYYVNAYYPVETHTGQYTVYDAGAQVYKKSFNLKPHPYLNMAYYIDQDLKPIKLSTFTNINPIETLDDHTTVRFHATSINELKALANMVNTEEYFPNGLKVSKTDNPMFFPVENAYQVGSAEILALMSNTIAVGTGQTGAAPLYVFCKDGVYALFVDASGQMTYSNSRVLARDVCNNPRSVTPIDAGVVFTTDRGLMMIAGEQVEEIGQPAEGDVLHYTNVNAQSQPLSVEGSKIATDALTKIAGLPSSLCDTTDFLTYLQGAIVNYNHNMRELIVTNPNKSYSYVLDREGNWSRRDYTAAEYVNNYPTSYRVAVELDANNQPVRRFYKLDDEGDASTSLEHRKEADNQIFYISNVIKLDSIGFKQAYRFVVRGYFETKEIEKTYTDRKNLGTITIDPSVMYGNNRKTLFNIPSLYGAVKEGDIVRITRMLDGRSQDVEVISKGGQPPRLTFSENLNAYDSYGEYIISMRSLIAPNVGIVVEGSYDGIKFAPLGYNRKTGKFTNIGCHVSHTDVRFYRVILCGQVTGKTRIEYMEMSASGSVLNTKIR